MRSINFLKPAQNTAVTLSLPEERDKNNYPVGSAIHSLPDTGSVASIEVQGVGPVCLLIITIYM